MAWRAKPGRSPCSQSTPFHPVSYAHLRPTRLCTAESGIGWGRPQTPAHEKKIRFYPTNHIVYPHLHPESRQMTSHLPAASVRPGSNSRPTGMNLAPPAPVGPAIPAGASSRHARPMLASVRVHSPLPASRQSTSSSAPHARLRPCSQSTPGVSPVNQLFRAPCSPPSVFTVHSRRLASQPALPRPMLASVRVHSPLPASRQPHHPTRGGFPLSLPRRARILYD